jgi:hypothetical protein
MEFEKYMHLERYGNDEGGRIDFKLLQRLTIQHVKEIRKDLF